MGRRNILTAPSICEDIFAESGLSPVAGIDEAGRGPLAGPVVACALVLPDGLIIEGVNDSKKISAARREALSKKIKEAALGYAYGIIDADTIDRINILQATLRAMSEAVSALSVTPKVALVDGNTPPRCHMPVVCIVRGDSKSHVIAAAGILAKVKRDEIMTEMHEKYPEYGFNAHKGYGTAAHKNALDLFGLCPEHRKSFCREKS